MFHYTLLSSQNEYSWLLIGANINNFRNHELWLYWKLASMKIGCGAVFKFQIQIMLCIHQHDLSIQNLANILLRSSLHAVKYHIARDDLMQSATSQWLYTHFALIYVLCRFVILGSLHQHQSTNTWLPRYQCDKRNRGSKPLAAIETLGMRQNGRQIPGDIFKCIFLSEHI